MEDLTAQVGGPTRGHASEVAGGVRGDMASTVLTVNAGSHSAHLVYVAGERAGERLDSDQPPGSESGLRAVREFVAARPAPDVVGHRLVHGGDLVRAPAVVDDRLRRAVGDLAGLAPLDGVPMSTRSGAVDPGMLLWLLDGRLDRDELADGLYHRAGLLGLSGGRSGDTRELVGRDGDAALALAVFAHRCSPARSAGTSRRFAVMSAPAWPSWVSGRQRPATAPTTVPSAHPVPGSPSCSWSPVKRSNWPARPSPPCPPPPATARTDPQRTGSEVVRGEGGPAGSGRSGLTAG